MPCHHKLERYLDEYMQTADIEKDRKGPLFRSALGKTQTLTDRPISRFDAWAMVRRCGKDAERLKRRSAIIPSARPASRLSQQCGRIEVAQHMAGHANVKTTGLYDRRSDDISISEIERVGI